MFLGGLRQRFVKVKAHDHVSGFIFNGGPTCGLDFRLFISAGTVCGAVLIIIGAGCRIANSKACGIFDDQPGKEQATEFQQAEDQHQQKRQDQRKLHHALGSFVGGFGSVFIVQ